MRKKKMIIDLNKIIKYCSERNCKNCAFAKSRWKEDCMFNDLPVNLPDGIGEIYKFVFGEKKNESKNN